MQYSFLKRGTVLIYTMVLVVLGVFMATVILNISVQLSLEYDARNIENSLISTINTKGQLAMKYSRELNASGSGFVDILGCPQSFTMSGALLRNTNISSTLTFMSGSISCSTLFNGKKVELYFNPDFSDLDFVQYDGLQVAINTLSKSNYFSDAENTFIDLTLSYPLIPDGIDDNFDSDNYSISSTGSLYYPNKYSDNDADARLMNYGYIIEDSGFFNVFWNNKKMNTFINANPHNIDTINVPLSTVGSGYLYLDINTPFRLRLYKINSLQYKETKEFILEEVITTSTGQIASIGYVQNNLTLASGTGSAYNFDFSNNDYALFIENITNSGALLYKIKGYVSTTGSGIYLNALDDSKPSVFSYLGSHMLIDDEGKLIGNQYEVYGLK